MPSIRLASLLVALLLAAAGLSAQVASGASDSEGFTRIESDPVEIDAPKSRAYRSELLETFEQGAAAQTAPSPDEPLDQDLREAIDEYRAHGEAPVVQRSTVVLHPYGQSQPTLTCSLRRVCLVELEVGEIVYDVACGDCADPETYEQRREASWLLQLSVVGDPDRPAPVLAVRPLKADVATNVTVLTNRRIYHVGLHSPAGKELADRAVHYQRHLAFYYPEALLRRITSLERARELAAQRQAEETATAGATPVPAAPAPHVSYEDLNLAYSIEPGKGAKRVSWMPVAAYDDGTRAYIQLPDGPRAVTQPAIVLEDGGKPQVPNFHYETETRKLVVHTLFDEAVLFEGVGRKRREVRIRALAR